MAPLNELLEKAEQLAASIAKDLPRARAAIAQARLDNEGAIAELEQQRTRAEAAEADVAELTKRLRREIENNARECREADRG